MRLLQFGTFLFLVLLGGSIIDASKILAVFPSTSKTNYILGQVLFEELGSRGHEITVISPFEIEYDSENIKQIKLTGMFAHLEDYGMNTNIFTKWDKSSFYGNNNLIYGTAAMAEYTLGHPKVQELLQSDASFDLLILDQVLCDSLLGLANHYGVPAIVFSSTATNKFTNEMVANPHNPAYNPISSLGYSDRMSFDQRLWNTFVSISEQFNYKYLYLPAQEAVYQRHFSKKNLPPLLDVIHNVSLVLINSHPLITYPRPVVPSMIEIGGLHLRKFNNTGLSQDVINWVEAAKGGVIYFSMGGNTKSIDLPENVRKAFTGAFSQLSGTLIIWKWENATLQNQTSNVIIGPWMPQQQLLAHPNVRLHITHGGLLGMMESVQYGKPVLGLPLAGEQEILVDRAVAAGYGLKLDYQNITQEIVLESIKRIMEDSSFRKNALKVSTQFREQPMKPMDKAMYYIEYVLKNDGGVPKLRSGALNLTFWERHLVDVALCIVGICLLPVALQDHGGETRVLMTEGYTSLEILHEYYVSPQGRLGSHMPFNFGMINDLKISSTAEDFVKVVQSWMEIVPPGHAANWVMGNHDRPRVGTRFGVNRIDAMNMIIHSLPGATVTYQGEEIGMTDVYISWEETKDPAACNAGEELYAEKSRDPCRTPFQWDDSSLAGFTNGSTTWLPVGPDYRTVNVKVENGLEKSHLKVYKAMMKLRESKTFQHGSVKARAVNEKVLAIVRELEGYNTYITLVNLGGAIEVIDGIAL